MRLRFRGNNFGLELRHHLTRQFKKMPDGFALVRFEARCMHLNATFEEVPTRPGTRTWSRTRSMYAQRAGSFYLGSGSAVSATVGTIPNLGAQDLCPNFLPLLPHQHAVCT